jgi:hypothetical protein
MMIWHVVSNDAKEYLGLIPQMFNDDDPRPVKEQIEENYKHGGGWRPLKGFVFDPVTKTITYPGDEDGPDEVYRPLGYTQVRDESIYVYDLAWVAIVQKDGSFEVSRMD